MASHELLRGLALLVSGAWHGAHAIAQSDTSNIGWWLQGIVRMVESDRTNSMYGYRCAGRPFPGMCAAASEIAALRVALQVRQ